MMTSNRPLEDWGKLLGDVPAAGAILDRAQALNMLRQLGADTPFLDYHSMVDGRA